MNNLYFQAWFLVRGDFIAGPITPVLGRGIWDVPVRSSQRLASLSPTLDWTRRRKPHSRTSVGAPRQTEEYIRLLREALAIW